MFDMIVNTPLKVSNGKDLLRTSFGNDGKSSQIYLPMIKIFYLFVLISALFSNASSF